jgi:GTPase
VASYPFTTLHPQLGIVEREGQGGPVRLTMADIPGIIEDAHRGRGLGLDFLRHIARTRLLVYVLDVADDAAATLDALQLELRAYDPALLDRPALAALNKVDLVTEAEARVAETETAAFGVPVVRVSALSGSGLEELRRASFELLPPRPAPVRSAVPVRRVVADPVRVERAADGGWVVRGAELEAVVDRFDASNRDAVAYLQHHFASLGVNKLLARAGARSGDDVTIAGAVFEYFDDAGSEGDTRASRASEAAEQRAAERRYLASQRGSDASEEASEAESSGEPGVVDDGEAPDEAPRAAAEEDAEPGRAG